MRPVTPQERKRAIKSLITKESRHEGRNMKRAELTEEQILVQVLVTRVKDAGMAKRRCHVCGVELRFGVNTSVRRGQGRCRLCWAVAHHAKHNSPLTPELEKRISRRNSQQRPEYKKQRRLRAAERHKEQRKDPGYMARRCEAQKRYMQRRLTKLRK